MNDLVRFLAGLVDLFRGRAALIAENALLRQQLIVAKRKLAGRVRWAPWQRFTIGLATRIAPAWRSATLLIQPATVLRWHRAGFRVFWRRRSRPGGRPPSGNAGLIRQMAATNPRWGAERIRGELLKLGIRVAKRTVQKYMRRPKGPGDGQRWSTFLREPCHVGMRLRADLRRVVPRGLRADLWTCIGAGLSMRPARTALPTRVRSKLATPA
jgi:hypothetical protein